MNAQRLGEGEVFKIRRIKRRMKKKKCLIKKTGEGRGWIPTGEGKRREECAHN